METTLSTIEEVSSTSDDLSNVPASNGNQEEVVDPSLLSTVTESYEPDTDINAHRLPPDNVPYIVQLSLSDYGVKPLKHQKLVTPQNPHGLYLMASLICTIDEPDSEFNKWNLGNYGISSWPRNNTNAIVDLLRCTGNKPREGMNLGELLEFFENQILQAPRVKVRGVWEAYSAKSADLYKQTDKAQGHEKGIFLRGMSNFPQDKNGQPNPVVQDPFTGEDVKARFAVKQHIAVSTK